MKKMMIAAVLFALSAGSALASETSFNAGYEVGTQVSETAETAQPGVAVQVGKFFGGLLKAPLSVGRDVLTGFKAGITGDSQESKEAMSVSSSEQSAAEGRSASVASGPQGFQATLKDRLASARKSFAETCKNCNSGSERQMSVSSGSGSSRSGGSASYSMSEHTADVQRLAKDDVSQGLSLSSLFAKAGITGK